MLDTAANLLKVVAGFGLVIFIHELGHFLLARRNGVFVEKFAIGFDFWGLKLASWRRGGTEYVVGVFPLGGYVRMLGQNDQPGADPGPPRPDSYQQKSVRERLEIISAGVVFNFLSAFLFCWLALVLGYHRTPPVVAQVQVEALEAGLLPGDRIRTISGVTVDAWEEIFSTWASMPPGSRAVLAVDRAGESVVLDLPVVRKEGEPLNIPRFGRPLVPRISSVAPDSPAARAGLEVGDHVLEAGGLPVPTWAAFTEAVRRHADQDLSLVVERRGEQGADRRTVVLRPESKTPDLHPGRDPGFVPEHPAVLRHVAAGGPADKAGLKVGDRILAANGTELSGWSEFWSAATWPAPGVRSMALRVERAGTTFDVEVPFGSAADWALSQDAVPALGIAVVPTEGLWIGAVRDGGAAAAAGLLPGDHVVALTVDLPPAPRGALARLLKPPAGETEPRTVPSPTWTDLVLHLGAAKSDRLVLKVERQAQPHEIVLTVPRLESGPKHGYAGVGPTVSEDLFRLGPIPALAEAARAPFRLVRDTVVGLSAFVRGFVSPRLMSGPIGILGATYDYAEKSVGDLLNFLALLSVNLAVMNFLPIPVTDGGHAVFLAYERLRGRRMPEEVEARFQWAGLLFLLSLFVFASINDVGRLLGLL